jgi:ribulose-bisphosphate carboxylase large chain
MRSLAEDEEVNLPIISHPAFLGTMVTSPENGFSHAVIFGQLQRLAGADISIYPNYGGRFGFTRAECESISKSCRTPMGN